MSPRGDTLIFKDYRGDVSRNTSEKFWRHVKFSKGEAEPVAQRETPGGAMFVFCCNGRGCVFCDRF